MNKIKIFIPILFFSALVFSVFGQNVTDDGNIQTLVQRNSLEGMKEYLSMKGVSGTAKQARQESAVFYTAENGSAEMMQMLAEDLRLKVNIKNQYDRTPVHIAAEKRNFDVLKYLVEKRKLNPDEKCSIGYTPLILSIIFDDLDIVQYLVEDAKVKVNAKTNNNLTPLSAAAYWGRYEIFKYLAEEAGADIREKSVIVNAGASKNPEIVKLFNELQAQDGRAVRGSKLDAAKNERVFAAILNGDVDAFRELKNEYSGDFWKIKNRGDQSLLEYTAARAPMHMVEFIFNEYPNRFSKEEQMACLIQAAWTGSADTLRFLVEGKGFDPHLKREISDLMYYATSSPLSSRDEIIRYLVTKHGFDIEFRDGYGQTAILRVARWGRYSSTVKCLIEEFNANVSAKNSDGMNIFQLAALNTQGPFILKYLVEKFNPDVKKEIGMTVFSKVTNPATKAYLQQYF